MKTSNFFLILAVMSFQNFASAKDAVLPETGFPGCATKVLNKYPGFFTSVEAEGNNTGQFFYEFDVVMKNKIKPKEYREIEVECNPSTLELSDIEEEVKPNDHRFLKSVKITSKEAEKIALDSVSGIIVDREFAIENSKPIYEFDILDKKTKKEIEIEVDGVSGQVIEKEIEFFEVGVDS